MDIKFYIHAMQAVVCFAYYLLLVIESTGKKKKSHRCGRKHFDTNSIEWCRYIVVLLTMLFMFTKWCKRTSYISLSKIMWLLPARSTISFFLSFLCKPHAPGGKAMEHEQPSNAAGVDVSSAAASESTLDPCSSHLPRKRCISPKVY